MSISEFLLFFKVSLASLKSSIALYKAMEDFNDAKETLKNNKNSEIDIDNDYLLNEGAEILSDYTIFNQNIYLSKAA